MAKKKAVGSLRNGRDSKSKRMGVKMGSGIFVYPGNIIIRQRGLKYFPGKNVNIGKDYTIYSVKKGVLFFKKTKKNTVVNVQ